MKNIVLLKKTEELQELSKQLGFTDTLFLEGDVVIVKGKTRKELLSGIRKAKKNNKIIIYKPPTEELLRFALEKSSVDIVYGMEEIHPKDHTHYVRGGLDQITCRIAAQRGKVIGFSFSQILNSSDRAKLLGRIRLNLKLCKKYGVEILFSNFSCKREEMRSKRDLVAFVRILKNNRNIYK